MPLGERRPRKPEQPFTTPRPNPPSPPTNRRHLHRRTAGRWAIPARGSSLNRPPPRGPIRVHHRRSSGRARAVSLGRSLQASCLPLARCWLVLGIPAFTRQQRRLHGTGPPLAHPYSVRAGAGKGYRHLASLGASPLFHKSPPARAGGTAGHWARDAPGSPSNRSPPQGPIRHHHQQTIGTWTTGTWTTVTSAAGQRAIGQNQPLLSWPRLS